MPDNDCTASGRQRAAGGNDATNYDDYDYGIE